MSRALPSAPSTTPPAPGGDPRRIDLVGALVAIGCAVHCAATPLLLAALPLAVGARLAAPALEWGLVAASLVLGAWSLARGGATPRVAVRFAGGFAAVIGGRLAEDRLADALAIALAVGGGLLVASAHLAAHRAERRRCAAAGCPEPCCTPEGGDKATGEALAGHGGAPVRTADA